MNQMKIKTLVLLMMLMLTALLGRAQVITPGFIDYDYHRVMSIRGESSVSYSFIQDAIKYESDLQRSFDPWARFSDDLIQSGIAFRRSPILVKSTFKSGYAKSMNDGALWYGRGLTQEVHAGFQWSRGILDVTMQPVLFYSQNRGFDLPVNPIFEPEYQKSPFGYPFDELIDYVIRYGDDPFVTFHPGQSDVSIRLGNIRTGISTQNTRIGPSWYNPILLSANAPGFPHLYIQTRNPIRIPVFDLEFKQSWGVLRESTYFDDNPDNNWRYFAGLFLGLNPRFAKGLQLGFNRTFIQRGTDFELMSGDPLVTLYRFKADKKIESVLEPNDAFDQIASVTGRWTYPEVGFEAHFEFALNDFGSSFWGSHPDHSRAYTIGITQLFDGKDDEIYALTAEMTNTAMSKTGFVRPPGSYYIHMTIEQGYSNQGQIIGSGMGPGGAMGYTVFLRKYSANVMHGLQISYQRINEDFYFLYFDTMDRHDFEMEGLYTGAFNLSGVQLEFQLGYARRANMNMVPRNNVNQLILGFSLRY